MKQLNGQDPDTFDIDPIDLRAAIVKERSSQWLVDLAQYMAENPQIIVNRFVKTGITAALHGTTDCDHEDTDMELETSDD